MRWCLLYVSCHPDGAFSIDRHFVRRHGGKAGEDVRIGWLWEKGGRLQPSCGLQRQWVVETRAVCRWLGGGPQRIYYPRSL